MKRIVVGLLLLALTAAVFADDALVLPKGVLRTYFTGAYAFASQEWDDTGEKIELSLSGFDSLSAINLGGAIEFGVIDWISAAVQWAPGWNVWSATKNGTPPYDKLQVNGPYNVFAGAKIQIIGPKAPVANEKIRLAAAAGVKIPVKAPDAAYWSGAGHCGRHRGRLGRVVQRQAPLGSRRPSLLRLRAERDVLLQPVQRVHLLSGNRQSGTNSASRTMPRLAAQLN